jgi:hypothetical protein
VRKGRALFRLVITGFRMNVPMSRRVPEAPSRHHPKDATGTFAFFFARSPVTQPTPFLSSFIERDSVHETRYSRPLPYWCVSVTSFHDLRYASRGLKYHMRKPGGSQDSAYIPSIPRSVKYRDLLDPSCKRCALNECVRCLSKLFSDYSRNFPASGSLKSHRAVVLNPNAFRIKAIGCLNHPDPTLFATTQESFAAFSKLWGSRTHRCSRSLEFSTSSDERENRDQGFQYTVFQLPGTITCTEA